MLKLYTNGWIFEVKEVRGIKVEKFGDPIRGMVTIRDANGDIHTEGFITLDGAVPEDGKALEEALLWLEADHYIYRRFKRGGFVNVRRSLVKTERRKSRRK